MNEHLTLVLGGARSGKSAVAEGLAGAYGQVTYVATAPDRPGDESWAARVDAHRRRRPPSWTTVELGRGDHGGDLAACLAGTLGPLLVDSLGAWLVGFMDFEVDASPVVAAMRARRHPTVVVTEEVGLGVHPSTEIGGRFRDALGTLNQDVAAVAGTVLLVVAGRVLPLA